MKFDYRIPSIDLVVVNEGKEYHQPYYQVISKEEKLIVNLGDELVAGFFVSYLPTNRRIDINRETGETRVRDYYNLIAHNLQKTSTDLAGIIPGIYHAVKFYCYGFQLKRIGINLDSPSLADLEGLLTQKNSYLSLHGKTPTGKEPKYVASVHFSIEEDLSYIEDIMMRGEYQRQYGSEWFFGEVEYLKDGTIGKGRLIFWYCHCCHITHLKRDTTGLYISKITFMDNRLPDSSHEPVFEGVIRL